MAKRRSVLTNEGSTVYDQEIRGKRYIIKPGESVELPRYEAVMVRGHFCGINTPVHLTLKHLPIEPDGPEVSESQQQKVWCSPDGREFKSKAGLLAYMRKLAREEANDSNSGTRELQESAV